MDYRKLEREAYALRLTAQKMEYAAQTTNIQELFMAYCEIIVHHEKIRDIIAERKFE